VTDQGESLTGPQTLQATQIRHGTFYARYGEDGDESLRPTDEGLRCLSQELDNLHAAIRRGLADGHGQTVGACCWAVANRALRLGPFAPSVALLERVLADAELPPRRRAQLMLHLSRFHFVAGQVAEARRSFDQSLDIAPAVRDDRLRLEILRQEQVVLSSEGQMERSREVMREADQLAHELGDTLEIGLLAINQGSDLMMRGELVSAREKLEQGIDLLVQQGATCLARIARMNLASLDLLVGRLEASDASFRTLGQQGFENGNPFNHAVSLLSLGLGACLAGEPAESLDYLQQSMKIGQEIGIAWIEVNVLTWQGRVRHQLGQPDQARALLGQALEGIPRVGDLRAKGLALSFLANLQRDEGNLNESARTIGDALAVCRGVGDRLLVGQAEAIAGRIHHALGHRGPAQQCLELAEAVAHRCQILPPSDLAQRIAELKATLSG
jgi:tetratricopeptide (TPR) repeat protein